MSTILSGKLNAAPFMDANRYGRADRSAVGRWFWEIDRVLLLLVTVLIGIGLVAVAAASPAAAERYSGGAVTLRRSTISTARSSGLASPSR